MERLTRKIDNGQYELTDGHTLEEAVARLAEYENAHEQILLQCRQSEERLDGLRGQGKKLAFQQALAERQYYFAMLDRLDHPPKK